jgi:hypothetical protein
MSRSARNNSMTVLHSFVASSRSHSIPCRNFDRNTLLCKMCSDTTRAITHTRRCGRQTTRANHPADTPKQYWKVSLYYAFIRPHDNGIGVASDKIRKSLLCTVSASSCYSAVALVTGIVNMIHKMVSIYGYSTGFTASSVSQSEVGIWWRGVTVLESFFVLCVYKTTW